MDEQTPDSAEDSEDISSPAALAGEVSDFIRSHESRRRQFPRAALVGLLAGVLAVAFRDALIGAERLRLALITVAHHYPMWGIALPVAFGAAGAGSSVYLVRRFAPEASGSGIPHLKAVLHRLRAMSWQRIMGVKFMAGVLAIGGGLALGREGPTVQMGGAVGQMVSRWFKGTPRERQTLIAAGAGAGLAAAFNAPLSGVIFVLEELQRDFTPTVFTSTFVACVVADMVTRLLAGQLPTFHVANHPVPAMSSLPVFLLLGLLTGVLGVVFNRMLLACLNLFAKASRWPRGAAAALVGGSVGVVGWFLPSALGGGHELVEATLAGKVALGSLTLLFLLRFALTMFSYGSGAAGGIFAPLLVLGAQIGLFTGLLVGWYFPAAAPEPTMFAVVGMAAYFTAIVRAPLTGIVLIIEMTGNYDLMLPLLVACFSAYAIADLLGDMPIYEALLERDILRGQTTPELEGTLLLQLTVSPGAKFDGMSIRDLDLPPGCLIVTIDRGLRNLVADPTTILIAGDRITAVIAAEAAQSAAMLRAGAKSH